MKTNTSERFKAVDRDLLRIGAVGLALLVMVGGLVVPAGAEEDCGPITSSVVMTEELLACWDGWIIGDDVRDDITVDLNGLTITDRGIVVRGAGITVRNGTLDGTDVPGDTTGINAMSSRDALLDDLPIVGYAAGVELGTRTSLLVSHLEGNHSGVFSLWGEDARIRDNRFVDNDRGIAFIGGGGATIIGNHFEGNLAGIQSGISEDGGLQNSVIRSNRFERNGFGIAIEQFLGADNVAIEENEIFASESSGIAVISMNYGSFGTGGGRNVTIRNNLVRDSGSSPETVSTCLSQADGCVSRLANDGITVLAWDEAIPPTIDVTGNRTVGNTGHGIYAPGVTDGGGNLATANGATPACVGVTCVDDTPPDTSPPQDTVPPPAPRLGPPAAGDRLVDLQWSTVTDPTGPITYRLHRSTGSTCTASSPVVWTGTRTSTSDEPLTNGTRYRHCVTATDGAGNRSPASNTRTAEPRRTPATCTPLTGDWHASGRDGIGWWCDGQVRLRTADGATIRYIYGRRGDVPVVADWNGDGQDTVSVIRDGTWFLNNQLTGGAATRSFTYGRVTQGDVPITGTWTGGTRDLPGIIRDREWHLRFQQSGGYADRLFVYGRLTRGDRPLWGDWNANGRDTIGVVRDGTWLLRNELAGGSADLRYVYGRVLAGDLPVTGDWTGDGRATPAIVRDGRWMLRNKHAGGNADATIVFRQP